MEKMTILSVLAEVTKGIYLCINMKWYIAVKFNFDQGLL